MKILWKVYKTQKVPKEIRRRKERKGRYVCKKQAKRKSSLRGRKKDEIREIIIYFCKTFKALDVAANKWSLLHIPPSTTPNLHHSILNRSLIMNVHFNQIFSKFFSQKFVCILCWLTVNLYQEWLESADNYLQSKVPSK